jgi:AcrR family transcriptional regulator
VPAAEHSTPETARRPKDRKARIALAAAELFCEHGYHGVTVEQIAAVVGISGPAVYRHFPTKYAILVHATREISEAFLAATATTRATEPAAALDELLGEVTALAVERRRVSGLYQWEWRYLTAEHRREFGTALSTLVDRLATPLRAVRPELGRDQATLLVNAALSAVVSPGAHRTLATGGQAGTVDLLIRVARVLLAAEPPTLPSEPRPAPAAARLQVESRRELLLLEAIRLFRRHGYHAVGVEDIARAVGIQGSSVYRYYPSKADLLAAAYYRASDRLTAATSDAVATADDPADALRRVVQAYVDFAFGQSDLVAVYLAENNNLPDDDRHELRKAQRLQVEEWVRRLTATRPDLPVADARVLVHAALNVVTDVGRSGSFDRTPGFDLEATRLALATLRA